MQIKMQTYEQYLRKSVVPREVIDRFLDENERTWARFDSELGYTLGNSMPRDGMDGSLTLSTVGGSGGRTSSVYANHSCRINTYGDSFTQCAQVSDHETWQEYLAAHLGEPIRNYGVGGHGVYQAYRRLLRVEQTNDGAEYVILYVWGDDHQRSCMRCRHAAIYRWFDHLNGMRFHANFWANIEMDLESGELVERQKLLPEEKSLYQMCDPDFMWEALHDDLMVQLLSVHQSRAGEDPVQFDDGNLERLDRLSEILGVGPLASEGDREESALRLANAYGFAATRKILDLTSNFLAGRGKKLMVVLFCPRATTELIRHGTRYDQPIVDYIEKQHLRYFDMNLVHQEDYRCFTLELEEYWKRYRIGHYSPAGNHFFAHAIRPHIVRWLEPKPITYREGVEPAVDLEGYLPK